MTSRIAKRKVRSGTPAGGFVLNGVSYIREVETFTLDDPERQALAARYKLARELSGKTQREIAQAIGYTERQTQAYERGEVEQLLRVAHQWAKATGVRIEWLMTGTGDPLPAGDGDRLARVEGLLVELLSEIRSLREDGEAREASG